MRSKKLAGIVSALFLAAFVEGCGSVATVSGTILDGPVIGTTVTITDSNGKVVGTTKSGSRAEYSIPVPVGAFYPLRVSISGGTDQVTGEVPVEMESLIIDANQTTANVAPITFLIYQAGVVKAGGLGKVTSATVGAVTSDIISKFGFGIDSEDSNFDPITSSVGANNVASFIKSAQALAETVRRAVSPNQTTMNLTFKVIGEDMADGLLDGKNSGAALSREMPAGFDVATIVSTVTLQKALVGMEVINNSLKVTKSGGTQLSADDVKNRFSRSINGVEPTVTTAAALGNMEAITVSDKQKNQVTTDIDNSVKLRDALEPGVNNAAFVAMVGAAKGLEVGKPGTGKVDNLVMVNAENAVNLVTGGIRDKAYTAGVIKAAFSAVVPSAVTPMSAGSSGNASVPISNTAEYIPSTARPTVNFGGSFSGILASQKDNGGKKLAFKIDTNGKKGTATITDPTTGNFTYQSNRFAVDFYGCLYEFKISQVLNEFTNKFNFSTMYDAIEYSDYDCSLLSMEFPIELYNIDYDGFIENIAKGNFGKIGGGEELGFKINDSDVFTFVTSDGVIESQPIPVTIDIVNKFLPYKPPTERERIAQMGQPFNGILSSETHGISGNLTYRVITQGAKGTVTLTDPSTGVYTYLPRLITGGEDGFVFVVTDGSLTSLPQRLSITIANIPPSVKDVNYSGAKNTKIIFSAADFSNQFSDPNGDKVSKIKVTSLPEIGSLALIGFLAPKGVPVAIDQEIAEEKLGNLVFIPKTDWNGSTSFTYNASDGTGYATSGANVNITVYTSNNPPAVVVPLADQTWNGKETKTFQIPGNTFTDINGDTLVYSATLANDLPLPSWISFDPTTRTFAGNAINGDVAIKIKVTANDGRGSTATSMFNLLSSSSKISSRTLRKIGSEFLVDEIMDDYVVLTIASLGDLDGIVVWNGRLGEFYGKGYNVDGTQAGKQFRLNSPLNTPLGYGYSSIKGIIKNRDGSSAILWRDYRESYYYQGFDSKTNRSTERGILLNSPSDVIKNRNMSFTSVMGGGFVAVYESRVEGLSGIKGQLFNADVIPNGTELIINATTGSKKQINPDIASLNNGGFVVTWESIDDPTSYIMIRLYDSAGTPISGEQTVEPIINKNLVFPKVKELNNGNVGIVWGQSNNVYLRIYDSSRGAVSDKKQINIKNNNYQVNSSSIDPELIYFGDGIRSMVIWLSDSSTKIIGQIIDNNGTLIGDPFQINSQEKYCKDVKISRISPDRFMFYWKVGNLETHAQIFEFSTP